MRAEPGNLLILLSDEQRHDALGCAGNPLARTPRLDALAARGTRFVNAYTPSPICVPARAALATGLPVHRTGCWDNALAWSGEPRGWTHQLQAQGVRVESIGKLHFRDAHAPAGFDRQHRPLHVAGGQGQVWGSVREPLPETRGRSPLFDAVGAGESDYTRFDAAVADDACRWLAEHGGAADPWVLFVGFVAPHFPLVVPELWIDRDDQRRMPLPDRLPRDGHRRHPWVERMVRFMDHDAAFADDAARREAIACYWGLVACLDHHVGRVLDALDAADPQRRTRVLFTSDHGDNLGRRGLWNKCTLYRDATGVPMILAGSGVPSDRVCRTPVSLLDVHDTVLATVGLSPPASHGPLARRNLADVALAPDDPTRLVLSEYHAVGSVSAAYRLADAHHAYHHYVGFEPELFDLQADPLECHDLAGRAANAAELAAWSRRLHDCIDPDRLDAQAKAAQRALVNAVGGPQVAWGIGPAGASPVPTEAAR